MRLGCWVNFVCLKIYREIRSRKEKAPSIESFNKNLHFPLINSWTFWQYKLPYQSENQSGRRSQRLFEKIPTFYSANIKIEKLSRIFSKNSLKTTHKKERNIVKKKYKINRNLALINRNNVNHELKKNKKRAIEIKKCMYKIHCDP
jgi:hypothetical protein